MCMCLALLTGSHTTQGEVLMVRTEQLLFLLYVRHYPLSQIKKEKLQSSVITQPQHVHISPLFLLLTVLLRCKNLSLIVTEFYTLSIN